MLDPQSVSIARQLSTSVVRSIDATEANRIVNDPSVFPSVSLPGGEPIDLTAFVQDHRNVLMMCDGGAILFVADNDPGIYEIHTNFLDGYRGKHARDVSLNAYRWMFTHTDCMSILTRVPAFNRIADYAARHVGFSYRFIRLGVWPTESGLVDLKFYSLNYDEWIKRASPQLFESGKLFHRMLTEELDRFGFTGPREHPDEDCHDIYAGACFETIAHQPEKAVVLYNRWARFAGYPQIALITRSPLVIDIGGVVVLVSNDQTMRVIKCQLGRP